MASDDRKQLQRARNGDAQAFGQLAERHGPRVLRYLRSMVADDATADDVHQDAMKLALLRLDQLEQDDRFGSWLMSIAINRCRQHLRDQVLRQAAGDEVVREIPAGRHSALSSIVRRESAVQIALAIDRLPILLREAFVLFHLEDLPYSEIAELIDASENTLQVRVHRARALLRQQLGHLVDTALLRAPDPGRK